MNKSTVKPMQEVEVKESLKTMSKGSIAIRKGLTLMKLGHAHEAYDCDSFKVFINKVVIPEIDYSYDSCNDQANAGEIEYNVGGKEFIGINSYSALEPLIRAKLKPAKQKEVFQLIAEKSGFGDVNSIPKKHISKKMMEQALTDFYGDNKKNKTKSNAVDNKSSNNAKEQSYPDEVIENMHANLMAWADKHDEIDEDDIYGFFETIDEQLSEKEPVFEQIIVNSIDDFFNEYEKVSLFKAILPTISKVTVKKLLKSIH